MGILAQWNQMERIYWIPTGIALSGEELRLVIDIMGGL